MAEYIDREKLLRKRPFACYGVALSDYTEGYIDCAAAARQAVKDAHAADVTAVVRCGNCIYWEEARVNKICPKSGMTVREKRYCSYGKRRI